MRKLWTTHTGTAARPWSGLPSGTDPFCLLVDSLRDYAVFLLDAGGLIRSWNTGAALITGYASEDILGRHCSVLYTREEVETGWPSRELERAALDDRVEDEGWRIRKDGARFWANVITTAIRSADGTLYGYSTVLRDLTARKQQDDALKRSVERTRQLWTQAIKDPLTGAFNRRYLRDQLRGAIERVDWVTASLLLIDVDGFKNINDRGGHGAGDAALVGLVALARRISRDTDLVFRLGGDEFALYLPGVAGSLALTVAERLRAAVEQARLVNDILLTVSIGVAELAGSDTPESWVARADAALYTAKRNGRNRVRLAEELRAGPSVANTR